MKRSLVAITLVSAMLILTSCSGGTASSNTSTPSKAGEAKTLTLWTNNKSEAVVAATDEAIAQFKSKTGVDVKVTYSENDPYKTKLKTAMASKQAPDIFHSWGGGGLESYVDAGQVLDITDKVGDFKDQLPESAWGLDTFNGKIYGVPYSLAGTALFYNKTMFAKYNLSAPKTWSDVENIASVLIKNNIIPFALGNSSKWPGNLVFVYHSLRLGGGETFQNALSRNGKSTFEDPSYVKAGQMILDEVDAGWYPKGANGINYDTGGARMLFYTGKAGMMVMTTGLIANARDENKAFYDKDLGITTFPTIEGGKGGADEVVCGNNAYSVSKNCKNPDDAIAFLKFLVTDPATNNKMANEGGLLVALKSAEITDPMLKSAIDIQLNSSYMQNFYDQAMPADLATVSMDTSQALFGKTVTAEDAAKQVEAKAKETLK